MPSSTPGHTALPSMRIATRISVAENGTGFDIATVAQKRGPGHDAAGRSD